MSVTVNHSVTANLGGSTTLADLEQLVAAAKAAGLSSSASVSVTVEKYAGDMRDPGYTTITVRQR